MLEGLVALDPGVESVGNAPGHLVVAVERRVAGLVVVASGGKEEEASEWEQCSQRHYGVLGCRYIQLYLPFPNTSPGLKPAILPFPQFPK